MKLTEYPQAIATLQRQILDLEQRIIGMTESVKIFEAEIDKSIAFDSTLKNEAQRKSKKIEMQQQDGDYYQASRLLKESKEKRDSLVIDLEMLRNQFSVARLEYREAIAKMELQNTF